MALSPFKLMQQAVDIVQLSQHPTHPIAATLAGRDENGEPYIISKTNTWPRAIDDALGRETKIGGSSPTIHAEVAAILAAPGKTEGAEIFVTDPPCPNCAKNIIEAGISAVYIDHKGFGKRFAKEREKDLKLTYALFKDAGIPVFEVFRGKEELNPLVKIKDGFVKPTYENAPLIRPVNGEPRVSEFLRDAVAFRQAYNAESCAAIIAHSPSGEAQFIGCEGGQVIGQTRDSRKKSESTKYSLNMEPLNRAFMIAARHGLKLDPDYVFTCRVPTPREMVNSIGAGVHDIIIDDCEEGRDERSFEALEVLQEADILVVR